MSNYDLIYDDATKQILSQNTFASIKSIEFSLYSTEEIRKMSVCEVNNHMLHKHYVPPTNSVNDLRIGTADKRLMCGTCVNNVLRCFGHYAHIELAEAVYHPGYIKYIVKILRCVCYYCSRIRILPQHYPAKKDVVAFEKSCSKFDYCEHCQAPQPVFTASGCSISRYFNIQTQFSAHDVDIYHQKIKLDPTHEYDLQTELREHIDDELKWAEQPFTPKFCRRILQDISIQDCYLLGFSPSCRPENMILELLIVPPVAIRPYNNTMLCAATDDRTKGQSDLTQRLIKIIKQNESLKQIPNNRDGYLYSADYMVSLARLQNDVMEYIQSIKALNPKKISEKLPNETCPRKDNCHVVDENGIIRYHATNIKTNDSFYRSFVGCVALACRALNPSITQPLSGRMAGLAGRMRGKEGRLRANLCGKRVNWSCRSVISPDVTNDVNELGVPSYVAQRFIIPVPVSNWNQQKLLDYIRSGKVKAIQKKNTRYIDLQVVEDLTEITIEPGDVVERYLLDGDWVLFNRQPTLHKYSILAFKVKICDGLSFRLPLPTTRAFGADFDGDEMNMHKVMSCEAEAEMANIMAVEHNMISATNHSPIIAAVMDTTLGIFNMTQSDVFLNKKQVCDLCMHIRYARNLEKEEIFNHIPSPSILKPVELWTGKQIVSLLFPATYFCHKSFRPVVSYGKEKPQWNDGLVVIRNGVLLSGSLCKKSIGTSGGNIVHNIHNDYGGQRALYFVSDLQRLAMAFLTFIQPFSVGISDCLIPSSAENRIQNFLDVTHQYVQDVYRQFPKQKINEETEIVVTNVLRTMLPKCSGIIQHHLIHSPSSQDRNNRFLTMMTAGSKGGMVNIAQIMGCIGQQTINGKRLGFKNGSSLPCFTSWDSNPLSKGFVQSSYIQGLKPYEFFFHAAGGREGLIDTAVKTSETGYLSRRILKSMESHRVMEDGSVRNARNEIIQWNYAGNNIDTSCLERVQLTCLYMYGTELCIYTYFHQKWIKSEILKQQLEKIYSSFDLDTLQLLAEHEAQIENMCTQIRNARLFCGNSSNELLMPFCCQRILFQICNLCDQKLNRDIYQEELQQSLLYLQNLQENLTKSFPAQFVNIVMGYVRSESSLFVHTCQTIEKYCNQILKRLYQARIASGEMVGALAATSIGEPTTQLTLQTFHFAGCGNHTVTQGIPRLKELIDVSETIKTPSLKIYLNYESNQSMDQQKKYVEKVARGLEYKTFSYFIEKIDFIPVDVTNRIESMYDIRYELNIDKMITQNVLLEKLVQMLYDFFGYSMIRVFNADETTSLVWWIQIHFYDIRPLLHTNRYNIHLDHFPREYYAKPPTDISVFSFDQINVLREFHSQTLSCLHIQGLTNIKRCIVSQTKVLSFVDNHIEEKMEYIIQTDGSALLDVLLLPFVDKQRTTTNHVVEMYRVFGICAASNLLQEEINNVLTGDGGYVAESHIRLLVNTITSQGGLRGNNRHGIIKFSSSSLARASFEESVDILQKAALFGEKDSIRGVSETILTGKICPVGTGTVTVLNKMGKTIEPGQFLYTKQMLEKYIPICVNNKSQSIPYFTDSAQEKSNSMMPWG